MHQPHLQVLQTIVRTQQRSAMELSGHGNTPIILKIYSSLIRQGQFKLSKELTSDAVVWLLHADTTGNWVTARLFRATKAPTYTEVLGRLTRIGGDNGTEVQYEITF